MDLVTCSTTSWKGSWEVKPFSGWPYIHGFFYSSRKGEWALEVSVVVSNPLEPQYPAQPLPTNYLLFRNEWGILLVRTCKNSLPWQQRSVAGFAAPHLLSGRNSFVHCPPCRFRKLLLVYYQWQLHEVLVFIYSQPCQVWVAACGNLPSSLWHASSFSWWHEGSFKCGMKTLSCGMRNLVPFCIGNAES